MINIGYMAAYRGSDGKLHMARRDRGNVAFYTSFERAVHHVRKGETVVGVSISSEAYNAIMEEAGSVS
jgi:hypothetical protein